MMMKLSSLPGRIMVAATKVAGPSKRATGFKCALAHAYPSTKHYKRAVARFDKPSRLVAEPARLLFRSVVPTAPLARHGDETEQKPLRLFPVINGFQIGYAEQPSANPKPFTVGTRRHWSPRPTNKPPTCARSATPITESR